MEIKLNYGYRKICLTMPDHNITRVLQLDFKGVDHPSEEIRRALKTPIGTPHLTEIIRQKKPGQIVIVVTDITRPIPYPDILPAVLAEIHQANIAREQVHFVIATGAHRPNTRAENSRAFGVLAKQYRFTNHDCDGKLVSLGILENGTELLINEQVAGADMVITIGAIMPHNLAGFSGGPKLILPGVAGRETIAKNHAMMNRPGVGPGNISDNPVLGQLLEGAGRVGVDFIVNVVLSPENNIMRAFAGSMKEAWLAGCRFCSEIYCHRLPPQEEVVIAGGGGYPRDANLYQAVKALVNAGRVTKPGGTVVLLASCREGLGDPEFEQWMYQAKSPRDLLNRFAEQGFKLGGHKAYLLGQELMDKDVILVSDLAGDKREVPLLRNEASWEEAEKYLIKKHGPDYRALVLPFAGLVFPRPDRAI